MAAVIGVLFIFGLIFCLIGLCFKTNRDDKEYVKDVKFIAFEGIKHFILFPLMALATIAVAIILAIMNN